VLPFRVTFALAAGAVALALPAACAQAAANVPPLYLTYLANGSLSVGLTDGSNLGPSSAIPPGQYWVTFTNDYPAERDTVHKWHIFGPGIDIWTDLNCSDSTIEQYLETLRPSSTYTVQDDYHPALQVVFRTAATGSSTAGSSPGTPTSTSGNAVQNTDLVGSGLLPYRGSLGATVSAAGKLALRRAGKPVSSVSLRAGRYTIAVVDQSAKAGFTLEKATRAPLLLTTSAFVGRKSVKLELRAGKWLILSESAPPVSFVVVR
jgi:hypothetical protein